jgi:hypothetical protein
MPRLPLRFSRSRAPLVRVFHMAGPHGRYEMGSEIEQKLSCVFEGQVFPLACVKAEESPVRTLAWAPPDM